jgi:xanthine dehydrogenase iron-sulfur cluster and FAD-binding subunit A
MAFGGVGPITKRATKTEELLKKKSWDQQNFNDACNLLSKEFKIEKNSPGGKESYRTTLVLSFFKKFFDQSSEC